MAESEEELKSLLMKLKEMIEQAGLILNIQETMIHEPMVTLSSTKEARIYNGKKIASLTSRVGKTGQPLVKE